MFIVSFFLFNIGIIILIILVVPFIIFFERRFLGVLQLRYGVFFYFLNSFFLFLCDALKIISKFNVLFLSSSYFLYNFSSFIFFIFGIILIGFIYLYNLKFYIFVINLLFFLLIFCFFPFPLINISYLSNSIYSFLGNLRTIFLLVSYEIVLIFSIIILFISCK